MPYPVVAPFNTSPAYAGTFIPVVWASKLAAKFYAASIFGDIANTDYQGEITGMGDKIVINTAPTITVNPYVVGTPLVYQVPAPNFQEMNIDRGRSFAFQINDVLEYQAKPSLLDTFSQDAAEQMRISVDSNCIYATFNQAIAANMGATAGVASASYNLGTDAAPVVLTPANVLQKILELAAVLDEQNVPDEGRWLAIDPFTRTLLMQSNLAQAQFMGDAKSTVRNGLIGEIDRFKVYLTNQLPKGTAGTATPWLSGDGTESTVTTTGTVAKRRAITAGHRSALTFASQMTKMETVRNPSDFGDFIRALNVYGVKAVAPRAAALLVAA